MKRIKFWSLPIIVLCIIHLNGICSNGEDESVVAAPMKKTEQDALFSAIQSFVGKWWNGSDLYPDPCGWTPIQGVSCDIYDGFWYVTDLSIGPVHDNSLSCAQNVEFSPYLFALRHLKSLSFFSCFVSHPVSIPPQNWDALSTSLQSLEFRSNRALKENIPLSFGKLINLQSLVITENGLTGELPEILGKLINLRRLNLAGNSFQGGIPYTLGGLNRLLILDMSRNSLTGTLPTSFGGLSSLLKLDLSDNKLEGKIPEEIRNLKNLTLLDISNNRLSGGVMKSIQELSSLQELVLSNNPDVGGDIMSVQWRNLRGLTALDLSNMSLTGGIPDSISELMMLRFLGLNDNKLTGSIPLKIANLPNVGAVYMHGNNLTGEIKFSEWFYRKMGRRFGAWDNPNLCYPMGLVTGSDNVPVGVKQCEEEVMRLYDSNSGLLGDGNGNWNSDSNPMASSFLGLVLVVEALMVITFNFF